MPIVQFENVILNQAELLNKIDGKFYGIEFFFSDKDADNCIKLKSAVRAAMRIDNPVPGLSPTMRIVKNEVVILGANTSLPALVDLEDNAVSPDVFMKGVAVDVIASFYKSHVGTLECAIQHIRFKSIAFMRLEKTVANGLSHINEVRKNLTDDVMKAQPANLMSIYRSVLYGELTHFDSNSTLTLTDYVCDPASGFDNALMGDIVSRLPERGVFEFTRYTCGREELHGTYRSLKDRFLSATDGFVKTAVIFSKDRIWCMELKRHSRIDDLVSVADEATLLRASYNRSNNTFGEPIDGERHDEKDEGILLIMSLLVYAYLNMFRNVDGLVETNVAAVNRQAGRGRRIKSPAWKMVTVDLSNQKPAKRIGGIVREVIRRQGVREHEVSGHWRHFGGDPECRHRFEAQPAMDGHERQTCPHCGMRRTKLEPFIRGDRSLGIASKITMVTDSRKRK